MKKPREIEFEFAGFNDTETYVYWEQYAKALEEYVRYKEQLTIPVMPRRLTAENGAKALLMGEFFEEHECSYYDADGELVEYTEKVPVSWDTIKKIYKKVVAHYGA